MLTRRSAILGAAAAAAATLMRGAKAVAGAPAALTPVAFDVPAGACDCHTHVFNPAGFPFAPGRRYTPASATVDEMRALHRHLHVDRVVIVQPSPYGTDNRCMLDGLRQRGRNARGIAVPDDKTTKAMLDEMHLAGVRGIRLGLETVGQSASRTEPAIARQRFEAALARIEGRGWHLQIYTRLSIVALLQDLIRTAPVPVVFDHFGGAQGPLGPAQEHFDVLLDLVRSGKVYVKISAPYQSSTREPDFPDMAPLAAALVAANPQRILWGSDWPHPLAPEGQNPTAIAPNRQIDDGVTFNQLAAWIPDAVQRKTILVDNPARLYGF